MLDFIDSIRLSTEPISYPLPPLASPEEKAVNWLINEDPLQLSAVDQSSRARLIQRYALLTMWYSLDGPSWFNNDGWLIEDDECSWFGISCDANSAVNRLGADGNDLAGNNLFGSLPLDFALLESVWYISAGNNPKLTGPIPSTIGRLTNLTSLFLENCGLQGSLPSTLGNLTNLDFFQISSNALTGRMPSSMAACTRLTTFYVAANRLTGSLPLGVSQWSNLRQFVVRSRGVQNVLAVATVDPSSLILPPLLPKNPGV